MQMSVQYLEGGANAAGTSPVEARSRLRAAFDRVPIARVLLGWGAEPSVVAACADECARHRCEMYLWQPILTGHGQFITDRRSQVVGLNGEAVEGWQGKPEFTFVCPNRADVREQVLRHLHGSLSGGQYQGVFLDRIRFPSPALNFMSQFACFCDACQEAASVLGLDLGKARHALLEKLHAKGGGRGLIAAMLVQARHATPEPALPLFDTVLRFRQYSISRFICDIAAELRAAGLKIGLDCFSPTLTRMVGQDLAALAECCDWIKVMTYARAFAPASLPYEITGLAHWLASTETQEEQEALTYVAEATGWALPGSVEAIRSGGLPASLLTEELRRGQLIRPHHLLAGIELVELPGVAELNPVQISMDANAVRAGAPAGVVFCWDLQHISNERLELAASLYGD